MKAVDKNETFTELLILCKVVALQVAAHLHQAVAQTSDTIRLLTLTSIPASSSTSRCQICPREEGTREDARRIKTSRGDENQNQTIYGV